MSRRAVLRHIKSVQTYTIQEAAEALNVSVATIYNWSRDGLPMLKSKKPFLIVGAELREYVEVRKKRRSSPLECNEFRCFTCKCPVLPLGMMADYVADTKTTGRLVGLCSTCERECHRITSIGKIEQVAPDLDIRFLVVENFASDDADPSRPQSSKDYYHATRNLPTCEISASKNKGEGQT